MMLSSINSMIGIGVNVNLTEREQSDKPVKKRGDNTSKVCTLNNCINN